MPPKRAPGGRGTSAADVDRELARALSARRLLPWTFLSALGGGAIGWVAGGGPRAGAAIAAAGLLFVLFLWTTAIARCPACGTPLKRAGAAGGRPGSCPSCQTRFD
jgi:hypothetical protein